MNYKEVRKDYAYLSGKFVSVDEILAPLSLYAYGAFTTLKYSPDGLFFLDKHLERLKYNCKELMIRYPGDEQIIDGIKETINKNACRNKDAIIRVTLFPEHINWHNPQFIKDTPSSILVTSREMYYLPQNYKLKTVNLTRHMPHLKTVNYTVNLIAKAEAKEAGFNDALFVGRDGNVTEGTAWNIFFIKDGKVYTPPTESGLLEGITRGAIIQICKKLNIELLAENINISELNTFEAAFITNATQGPHPVMQLDQANYDIFNPVLIKMKEEYNTIKATKLFG